MWWFIFTLIGTYLTAQWLFGWGHSVLIAAGVGVLMWGGRTLVGYLFGEKYRWMVPVVIVGVFAVIFVDAVIHETLFTRAAWELGRTGARLELGKIVVPKTPPIHEEAIRTLQYNIEIIDGRWLQEQVAQLVLDYQTGKISEDEYQRRRKAVYARSDKSQAERVEMEKRLNPTSMAGSGSAPRCSLQARDNCQSCAGAATIHVQEQQVSEMKFPVVADKDCWSGWMKLPQGYVKGGIDVVHTGRVWIQEYGRPPVPGGPDGYNLFGGRVFRVMARTEDFSQEPVKSTTTFVLPGKNGRQAKK